MNVVNIVPMHPPTTPPRDESAPHISVLLAETLGFLAPKSGGIYVDATLGAGGHTEALLSVSGTRVIGFDRDESALGSATARLSVFGDRFRGVHARFSDIREELTKLGVRAVDGILADVGLSSMQLDDPSRGMSFRGEGPLDMRMDTSRGQTAKELIEALDDDELANVIYRFGEERRSRRVARCIKQAADAGELSTTLDLRRAVVRAVGPARIGGVDPATRTFQALRIAVNEELSELPSLIEAAVDVLAPRGVLAIISFHSLEDRIVKRAFLDRLTWRPLTKKPVVASEEECFENPRSRSAKLRAAARLEADDDFATGDEELLA